MHKPNLLFPSGVFGALFLVCGCLVGIFYDNLVKSFINEKMVIREKSAIFEPWSNPPVAPFVKFIFFNLTNGEGFLRGEKPNFQEIGPFYYRQRWRKVNIAFHANGTVTYQYKKHYFFDLSKSVGPEDAAVQTLNIPLISAVYKVKSMGSFYHLALDSMLALMSETALVKKTVKELLWGYPNTLLKLGSTVVPDVPSQEMGFFTGKNGSLDLPVNINTGERGLENYTLINSVNHLKILKYWKTQQCNMVNGSDGTSFPPNIAKNDVLFVYNENMCRSLPLQYNNTVQVQGLTGYRFMPPVDVFANVSAKPENECYCTTGPPCIDGGVFDVQACKFGTPSVISWAHFLHADEKYLNSVTGLKPDPAIHSSYVDVQPEMGVSLAALFRFQVNFRTTRLENIAPVENITEMVFPIMWFEEGLKDLPPGVISGLRMSLVLPNDIKLFLLVLFFVFGGLFLIGALIAYAFLESKDKAKATLTCNLPDCLPLKNNSVDFDDISDLKCQKNSVVKPLLAGQ